MSKKNTTTEPSEEDAVLDVPPEAAAIKPGRPAGTTERDLELNGGLPT